MNAPVAITGAGIGGLAAALALCRNGHDVLVLEQATELKEVGAGLQLSPNATRCLRKLGVLDNVRSKASEPENIRIRSASNGADLARVPLGRTIEARQGAPYLVVHRADLQKALYEKAHSMPNIEFYFGQKFDSVFEEQKGLLKIANILKDGSPANHTASGLIGADGVWSKVREMLPGHETAQFSGKTAYRATVSGDTVDESLLRETGLWLGADAHLVHYPIRGGKELNIVALVTEPWHEKTWSSPASKQTLLGRFTDWPREITDLLQMPDHWLKWALCGVPASGRWFAGRLALLGDAAHGMLPFAAQGAAMALEDALVLADVLKPETADIETALATYQHRRQARVVKVQSTAVTNGRIYHMSGPLAFSRDMVLRLSSPDRLAARMDWIYNWHPPQ